jgi:hypothetical protein
MFRLARPVDDECASWDMAFKRAYRLQAPCVPRRQLGTLGFSGCVTTRAPITTLRPVGSDDMRVGPQHFHVPA